MEKLYIYVSSVIRTEDMLTVISKDSKCAKLLGLTGTNSGEGGLICHTTSLLASFDGEGYDECSFYSGPSDATIFAYGESGESCGSIAYSDSESCGSIAYSESGESCGSIASSVSGSFSCGGGCDYAC